MPRASDSGTRRTLLVGLVVFLVALVPALTAGERPYKVQPGDTLFAIARRHQLTVDRILAANHMPGDATLQVGQTILIPDTEAPTVAPAGEAGGSLPVPGSYQVQAGDNLYRIASRYAIPVEELCALNGLTPKTILQIGQTIRIPAGVTTPPLAAVSGPRPLALAKAAPAPVATSALAALPAPQDTAKPAASAKQVSSDAAVPAHVWVNETRIHLRGAPSADSSSLGLVLKGCKLKVTGKAGLWWRVEDPTSGQTAYVAGWLSSREPVAPDPPVVVAAATGTGAPIGICYAAAAQLDIRAGASKSAERIAVAPSGTRMDILAQHGHWLQVRFSNGTTGWVGRGRVRIPEEEQPAPATGGGSTGVVETAMSYLGAPYVFGGTSRDGVDCSGLVYAVYREHGIGLPRDSASMYGVGSSVGRGNLRPGDLVFFKNTYKAGISHVGIYVGSNQFVHSANSGRGVVVSSLGEDYYASRYVGASRVMD